MVSDRAFSLQEDSAAGPRTGAKPAVRTKVGLDCDGVSPSRRLRRCHSRTAASGVGVSRVALQGNGGSFQISLPRFCARADKQPNFDLKRVSSINGFAVVFPDTRPARRPATHGRMAKKKENQLWDAARDGEEAEVDRLLRGGADVNWANPGWLVGLRGKAAQRRRMAWAVALDKFALSCVILMVPRLPAG